MSNRVEIPIGRTFLELTDNAIDSSDTRSLELIDSILCDIIGTGVIIAADDVSLIDIREYIEIATETIRSNGSISDMRQTSIRSRYNP